MTVQQDRAAVDTSSTSAQQHTVAPLADRPVDQITEKWDTARNPETLKLAFDEAATLRPQYSGWAKDIETKVIAVFGVSSAIISLAPTLAWGSALTNLSWVGWVAAVVGWLRAMRKCYLAYQPQDFRTDPRPEKLRGSDWLRLTPDQYRYYRLRDMGKTDDQNLAYLDRKGALLRSAMVWTAIEVGGLVVAFLGRFG